MRAQSRQPVLRCFPRDDEEFAAAVAAALRRVTADGQTRLGRVQSIVRATYPGAAIRPRDSLAAPLDDMDEVWYAFRDGRLFARHHEEPQLQGPDAKNRGDPGGPPRSGRRECLRQLAAALGDVVSEGDSEGDPDGDSDGVVPVPVPLSHMPDALADSLGDSLALADSLAMPLSLELADSLGDSSAMPESLALADSLAIADSLGDSLGLIVAQGVELGETIGCSVTPWTFALGELAALLHAAASKPMARRPPIVRGRRIMLYLVSVLWVAHIIGTPRHATDLFGTQSRHEGIAPAPRRTGRGTRAPP